MANHCDTIKLEKGMYQEAGRSFTQVLERLDPSEQYKGTGMEGLDAFQPVSYTHLTLPTT